MAKELDYVALFSAGGQAREYFRTATGNAAWVEDFCNGLVKKLDDTKAIRRMLTELNDDRDNQSIEIVRGPMDWKASLFWNNGEVPYLLSGDTPEKALIALSKEYKDRLQQIKKGR